MFPRYHQWESVTQLVAAGRAEGPGHRYLIQHSAGSGKTNSIAWTAHQLSTLHHDDGSKVFDSVIVVTIQTFGFALDRPGSMKGKSFAIIADEAHSSQTGTTANKVKKALGGDELADFIDGGEIDMHAVLAAEMESRAAASNISYFAYTATPKSKTLELFGRRPSPTQLPAAFHLYTMQQAIEEEFILDVLKNYTPYAVAFTLAHNGQEYDSDDPLVDKSQAVIELMQWVRLHEYNVSQKVALITERYRENVAWRLGGKATAMVVTGSRKEAVRGSVIRSPRAAPKNRSTQSSPGCEKQSSKSTPCSTAKNSQRPTSSVSTPT